ncbi:hypothetical protein [Clostridium tunisiense]|uniref:hypothetical protein n=1 Tax=Clostridium tunisiense TaxID=219748 RepID=UPI0002F74FF1|nr:hypothetical protein [Clostridium tunisiense]
MKAYFKLELKKTLLSWKTIISMIAIIICISIPYLNKVVYELEVINGVSYFVTIYQRSYIYIFTPVIVGFIYATSIIKDKETKFLFKLLDVINVKTYYVVKIAVNAIINFVVFSVSYIILALCFILKFGLANTDPMYIPHLGPYGNIYHISKVGYIAFVILCLSISVAAFSTFILGATVAFNNKIIAYILPTFYVFLTGIFFQKLSLNNVIDFSIIKLFNLSYRPPILNSILYDLILTIAGLLLIYKYGYKKEISSCPQS